ncbi:MAG TPA: HAD family hydrolase, partial [Mycobacteriales bacterium]|nr:HAD family hydrolase [Mycobacteriales bacterium]
AVMAPVMREAILGPGHAEVDDATSARVAAAISEFIDRTTGIQTLAQMEGLVGLVRRFGFVAEPDILDAHGYKAVYNRALMQLVEKRLAKLTSGQLAPEDYHLKNARPLLARFREAGAKLYLASGTDRADLVAEATALGFGEFFEDRMYGAVGDVAVEAKRDVLDAIIRGHDLRHEVFATFGDGPVEMRETRKRGGIAVGVCSDEIRRHGFNPAKRARLIRGGADILVPDFSDLDAIAALLGVDRP